MFAGFSSWQSVCWYCRLAVSTAVFVWAVARLVLKYRRGRGPFSFDRPLTRLRRAAIVVLTHSWIKRRDPVAGAGHFLIFYGFLVLFAGTVILGFQDDFAKPVLGWDFFRNEFYKGYSLFLDVFGAALIAGLAIMAYKRGIQKPFRLRYWRPDRAENEDGRRLYVIGDWAFLGILFFLALTGFLLESFRIAETNPSFEVWSPLGWTVGKAFRGLGMTGNTAADAHFVQWWVHGVAALGFVASIPFTKAVHMLASPASGASRNEQAGKELGPMPAEPRPEEVVYGTILDFPPRYLVQLDACTKCGKCHAACPATSSGYPLSPRDLILDLREVAEGALGLRHELHVEPLRDPHASILGDPIRPETLWSCMQCMACVEICPVGIEHVPIINQMRRRLVERGEMGLFNHLREENVAAISNCTFDRILTWDPHSFHTLRNEYGAFDVDWDVVHHSQFLLELVADGRLAPTKPLDYRITYHDPCTLGRYNGVYDEPRQVLAAIGTELAEMPRSRDNSFCCGAGGGRIWMTELKRDDAPRPSEQRIDEAVALGGIDYFVVCCPKDVTMYEDAIKTSGHQGEIELRELTELVLESLDLASPVAAGDRGGEAEHA